MKVHTYSTRAQIAQLAERKLDSIGAGAHRNVYALNKRAVLKVEARAYSTYCETERSVWKRVKNTPNAKYFAPVIAGNKGWLVMRRAASRTEADRFGWRDRRHDPVRRAGHAFGLSDLHALNIGYLSGRRVILDYAL